MRTTRLLMTVGVLCLTAACGQDRPAADDLAPAMKRAIEAVAGNAPVTETLTVRCGPTDQRLDGLTLTYRTAIDGPVSLPRAAEALTEQGLHVQQTGALEPALTAQPPDGAWRFTLALYREREQNRAAVTVEAEVNDDSATGQRPVTNGCG